MKTKSTSSHNNSSVTPSRLVNASQALGFDPGVAVYGFEQPFEENALLSVPEIDPDYVLDKQITRAILTGFSFNRRVLLHGPHGAGKSTHIEQVAARLGWPCQRINLDGQVSRLDLVGHDVLDTNEAGTQIIKFRKGMLTQAIERPVALVLDEYDAARPEVMFVLQRLLEEKGVLNLFEHGEIVKPHPGFRLFATSNTAGQGDSAGIYHGTQLLNQGQLDRWHVVAHLTYLPTADEVRVVRARLNRRAELQPNDLQLTPESVPVEQMIQLATMVRQTHNAGALTLVMSPRTVLAWAENTASLGNVEEAFRFSFLNRCDVHEQSAVSKMYFEVFGHHLASETDATRGMPDITDRIQN